MEHCKGHSNWQLKAKLQELTSDSSDIFWKNEQKWKSKIYLGTGQKQERQRQKYLFL